MILIDKESNIPLYLQLMAIFTENIRKGIWSMGEKLPSEKELVAQYGVSLITVRKTLDELSNMNVIYKIQGKGSFVSYGETEKYNLRFRELRSFTKEMENNQRKAGAIVLSVKQISAGTVLSKTMDIEEHLSVLQLVRLRTIDNIPTHVSTSYIHPDVAMQLKDCDFTNSIYAELERQGYDLSHGSEEIVATFPPKDVAEYLGISSNTPVLDARCMVKQNGKVLLFTQSYINSKRLSISVELSRNEV